MISLKRLYRLFFKTIMYTTGILNLMFVFMGIIFEITGTEYYIREGYHFKILIVSVYLVSLIMLFDVVIYFFNGKNRKSTIVYRYIKGDKND